MAPSGQTLLLGLLLDWNLPWLALTKIARSSPCGLVTDSLPTRFSGVFMWVDSVPAAGTVQTGLVAAHEDTAKAVIATMSAPKIAARGSRRRFTSPPMSAFGPNESPRLVFTLHPTRPRPPSD